jgi:hypothetical protein
MYYSIEGNYMAGLSGHWRRNSGFSRAKGDAYGMIGSHYMCYSSLLSQIQKGIVNPFSGR